MRQETEEFSYQAPEMRFMTYEVMMDVMNLTSFQLNAPPTVLAVLKVRQILKQSSQGCRLAYASAQSSSNLLLYTVAKQGTSSQTIDRRQVT